jgi:hypothetical protein
LQTIFTEEEARLTASLAGQTEHFIRDFPAKSYFSLAAGEMDMEPDAVVRVMCQALKYPTKRPQRISARSSVTPLSAYSNLRCGRARYEAKAG